MPLPKLCLAFADGLHHAQAYAYAIVLPAFIYVVFPAQEKPSVGRLCQGGGWDEPGAVVPAFAPGLLIFLVHSSFSSPQISQFVTQVARLEQLLRGMYQKVLSARASQWDSLRADCVARMEELAEVFGGRQQLSRVVASKKLEVGGKLFNQTYS